MKIDTADLNQQTRPMEAGSKYDVAISFLYGDLALARKLYDALTPQFSVFLSEECQGELGGRDGVDRFTAVFRSEARVVVVLYREAWGTTRWTRIEETAIKDRWLNDGADFLLFVNLEPSDAKPRWLPDTKLWMRISSDWKVDDIVTAITFKAREAGVIPQRLTARDLAVREQRRIDDARERQTKLRSEGATAGAAEVKALFDSIETIAGDVNTGTPGVQVSVKRRPDICALRQGRGSVVIAWNNRYGNTDLGAALIVREWDGPMGLPEERLLTLHPPRNTKEIRFAFDYVSHLGWCWRDTASDEYLITQDLADRLVRWAIENGSRLDRKINDVRRWVDDDNAFA